jgi:hypothetical protein
MSFNFKNGDFFVVKKKLTLYEDWQMKEFFIGEKLYVYDIEEKKHKILSVCHFESHSSFLTGHLTFSEADYFLRHGYLEMLTDKKKGHPLTQIFK